jgi:hypothetical protein
MVRCRVSMAFPTLEIRRRPSMAFFAIHATVMVIGSYLFVILLAAGWVYFSYFFLSRSDSASGTDRVGQFSMHYEKAPRFRRSTPDEAPPPLRCAVQAFAPLRRR